MARLKESAECPAATEKEILHDQLEFAQNKIDTALMLLFDLIEENSDGLGPHREDVKNVRDKLVVLYHASSFSLNPILEKLEPDPGVEAEVKKVTRAAGKKKKAREEKDVVVTEEDYAQLETSVLGSFELLSAEQKDRLIRHLVNSF